MDRATNTMNLVRWRGPIGPRRAPEVVPLIPGGSIWDHIPDEFRSADVVDVKLNGKPVDDVALYSVHPATGDTLELRPIAGAAMVASLVMLVIGVALKIGEYHLTKYQKKRARQTKKHSELGTFTFDIMGNTVYDGAPCPVVMGQHRTGGVMIQQFTRGITQDNREKDVLYSLLAVSEGPVSAITDCHLDGNDITNYAGATLSYSYGNITPSSIPSFRETTTSVAYNNQLTTAAAITCSGTAAANRFMIKLTFASGLYYLDGDGQPHSSEFKVETRYRTTAGPGAWSAKTLHTRDRRRADVFSIYISGDFPSLDTYDVEISRSTADHGTQDSRVYADAYVKEYQQISYNDLIYPRLALAGVKAISTDSLTGGRPEITVDVKGMMVPILASATAFSAAAWTQNNADLALSLFYSRRWGFLNECDPGIELTMTNTALDYTVGETVTGAAGALRFIGIVESWNSSTRKLIVEVQQGLPYGTLTGATSTKAADVSSVDESYAVDLASLWTFRQFCEAWVPDGGTRTSVNQNSLIGTDTLYVADTSVATTGDHIRVNTDGARDEVLTIASVGADHYHTTTNLVYGHTLAQGDLVAKAQVRSQFDYVFANGESGWDALNRICRCARCIPVRYGAFTKFVILKNDTPSGLISEGNILLDDAGKSTFKITYPEITTRPNRLTYSYRDRDYDYQEMVDSIDDPLAQVAGEKPFTHEDERFGITRRSQLRQLMTFELKRLRYTSGRVFSWWMGLDAIDFEAGDVRWLGHAYPECGIRGGRVASSTNSTITLDQPITVSGGESIRIRHDDGMEEPQTLGATAGTLRTLSITSTWTSNPAEGDLYAVGDCQRVRILGIKPTQDLKFEITAEPDDTSYYVDDFGVLPTWTESAVNSQNTIPSDVTGVTLTGRAIVNRDIGSIARTIQVDFTKPTQSTFSYAEIWLKETSTQTLVAGRSDHTIGTGANGEFAFPHGVCADGTYVYVADYGHHCIRKHKQIDLSWVANIGTVGTASSADGQFNHPTDVVTDGTHIWVVDQDNFRIQKLTVAGVFVAKLGTSGAGADQFKLPCGICKSGSYVYVTDQGNSRIIKIDSALVGSGGGTWTAFGSVGSGDNQFDGPQGIATDGTNVYVSDTRNSRIKKHLCSDLSYVAKLGTSGAGDNQFSRPCGICVDSTPAALWVADWGNHRIVKVSTALVWEDSWGTDGWGRMSLTSPCGIAWNDSKLWISDNNIHQIQGRYDLDDDMSGSFEYVGKTSESTYTIANVRLADRYEVAVVAVSIWGARKDPESAPSASITINEVRTQPPNVTGFIATAHGYGTTWVDMTWTPVYHVDLWGYEIRRGGDWQTGTIVHKAPATKATDISPPNGVAKYWIAAITTSQPPLYSATPASYQISTVAPLPQLPPGVSFDVRA